MQAIQTNQDLDRLQNHVDSIAKDLIEGLEGVKNEDDEPMSAYDYLEGCLDIHWILNNDRSYRGARVLVAFGGPNIWIDTEKGIVDGYWWGDHATASFTDNIGLDDALETLFNC